MWKTMEAYFKKHPYYNSFVHLLAGMGIGVLLTLPFFAPHTVRWGIGLLALGILAHLYPLFTKK